VPHSLHLALVLIILIHSLFTRHTARGTQHACVTCAAFRKGQKAAGYDQKQGPKRSIL
jgi:hypothetical protein